MDPARPPAPAPRRRLLPSWMTSGPPEGKAEEDAAVVAAPAEESLGEARTVYCMNEAELVEAALEILTESQERERPPEPPSPAGSESPRLPSAQPESPWSPEGSGDASPDTDLAPRGPVGSQEEEEEEKEEDEEDDMKYVREIFFS
ncbi:cell cycle regulator of non-homologous end joining [Ornithorhynchus anatinus]|uniref:cell cycle regulator of non-homologous end joining n=1 Tax=Ornithorhynchus anatinus TaxID=9258 RepID=UPI0010A8590A|nr:cell cycle regulator of non-homologous end joining [Ornithorhynchus anatinus]